MTPLLSGRVPDLNVSHQGDYAVLAGEEGTRVGVDIMDCTRPSEWRKRERERLTSLLMHKLNKNGSRI